MSKPENMVRFITFTFIVSSLFSCQGSSPDYDDSLPALPSVPPPVPVIYKVVNVYPHDTTAFTQGLELHGGRLWESTGELKQSRIRIVNLKTGVAEKSHTVTDPEVFGEGITIMNDKVYQLTWRNRKIFEYNINDINTPVRSYPWNYEGWGVTNNGHQLIISDGTANLYFVTPDESAGQMKIDRSLTVRSNLGMVDQLNELELIDGSVYANRWHTDDVYIIDTTTGYVTGLMNFKGIIRQYDPGYILGGESVLNGIAYDSATKRIFITGKEWPKLFEIELAAGK